jgi:hypothetical protein
MRCRADAQSAARGAQTRSAASSTVESRHAAEGDGSRARGRREGTAQLLENSNAECARRAAQSASQQR